MDRLGIILAAGEASRLPNKPLLPIEGDYIAIESSIKLLRRSSCKAIVIVIKPDSIIPQVLRMRDRFKCKIEYAVQVEPGVVGAIKAGLSSFKGLKVDTLVAFCDNVYDARERCPISLGVNNFASVRQLESHNPALEMWDPVEHRWLLRGNKPNNSVYYFAGWLRITNGFAMNIIKAVVQPSMFEFLSCFSPCRIENAFSWYDIGTEESYAKYLDFVSGRSSRAEEIHRYV